MSPFYGVHSQGNVKFYLYLIPDAVGFPTLYYQARSPSTSFSNVNP
jgi:hypothetical protein